MIKQLKEACIRTSIFVDPDPMMVEGAYRVGADRIELYTEPYASQYMQDAEKAVAPFVEAAKIAKSLGLGINAGHDLNLKNLKYLVDMIPYIDEVSIGHALVADALYLGLHQTVKEYLECLKP